MRDDLAAVEKAVLDYAEGWFLGDPERMTRALHAEFIKRQALGDGQFEVFDRDALVSYVEEGIGVDPDCEISIIVDDVSETIATSRCYSCDYIDLVHLGKFGDEWKLVNVFYRHR